MKIGMFHDPLVNPDEIDDFWKTPQGTENLPRPGARCLFELKPDAVIRKRSVKDGFRAFGYRADERTIMLPFWNARLGISVIKHWQYAPGPDFWNGTLKPY